jgi:hypothetical protein
MLPAARARPGAGANGGGTADEGGADAWDARHLPVLYRRIRQLEPSALDSPVVGGHAGGPERQTG